jgi:hypothetical protein
MVRASCLRDASGDCLVVETDDPAFRAALSELFYEEHPGRHTKRFPPGTVSDEIFRRFESQLEPLLRQTARLEPAPWEDALRETARRLDNAQIDWWLTGSAALAVRGIPVAPRDLDIVVSDEGAAAAATAFHDVLIEPAVPVEGWFCRWWGRAWIGARVEWVGGVTEAADQPLPTDFGLIAAATRDRVAWNDLTISVPSLELQRAVSARRGLTDRVRLIDSLGANPAH